MTVIAADPERAEGVSQILKALAHPLRIRIVSLLVHEDECHVNGIASELEVNQSIVSQHLRILRMQHLVQSHRRDGFAWYQLAEPKLVDLLGCLEGCKQH
jgi:DNA-binding transcriptional ArsR family regulator